VDAVKDIEQRRLGRMSSPVGRLPLAGVLLCNKIHIMCYNLQMTPTIKNLVTCDEFPDFVVQNTERKL